MPRAMVEVNVAQLLKEPLGAERHYRLGGEEGAGYLKEVHQVKGELRLVRLIGTVLVTGRIEALMEMACVRCLETFRQVVAFKLQEEYYPVLDVYSGASLPPPEDSTSFTIGPDHVLDLSEALRQYTLLAVPMNPLCQPDCLGLCSQCGANLNQGPCQCPTSSPDPRLAALAELKSKLV